MYDILLVSAHHHQEDDQTDEDRNWKTETKAGWPRSGFEEMERLLDFH
jgi:hypothetical protein